MSRTRSDKANNAVAAGIPRTKQPRHAPRSVRFTGPNRREAAGIIGLALVLQVVVWGLLWEVFGVARMGYWFFDVSDISYYYESLIAQIARGLMPFRDFFIEYPPLFVPLLVMPGTHANEMQYAIRFAVVMMAFMAASAAVSSLAAFRQDSPKQAYVPATVFAGYTLLLGPIAANRYDPAVALVVAGVILALVRRRWTVAGVLIGIGFALKITPVLLLPLLLILAPRKHLLRAAIGCVLAAAAPFLWVLLEGGQAASNLWQMVQYHLTRPLEIESLLATPFWIGRLLGGSSVKVGLAAGSQIVVSDTADLLAKLSTGVLLLALAGVYAIVWRRRRAIAEDTSLVFLAVLTALLASLVGSKVLSPQYFVWLVPAVALVALDRRVIGILVGLALLLTHVLFPANYWAFAQFQLPGAVALVVARNLLVAAAFALCMWQLWRAVARQYVSAPVAG